MIEYENIILKIDKTKQIFCIRNWFLKKLRKRITKPKRRVRATIVKIINEKKPEEIYIRSQKNPRIVPI